MGNKGCYVIKQNFRIVQLKAAVENKWLRWSEIYLKKKKKPLRERLIISISFKFTTMFSKDFVLRIVKTQGK